MTLCEAIHLLLLLQLQDMLQYIYYFVQEQRQLWSILF